MGQMGPCPGFCRSEAVMRNILALTALLIASSAHAQPEPEWLIGEWCEVEKSIALTARADGRSTLIDGGKVSNGTWFAHPIAEASAYLVIVSRDDALVVVAHRRRDGINLFRVGGKDPILNMVACQGQRGFMDPTLRRPCASDSSRS